MTREYVKENLLAIVAYALGEEIQHYNYFTNEWCDCDNMNLSGLSYRPKQSPGFEVIKQEEPQHVVFVSEDAIDLDFDWSTVDKFWNYLAMDRDDTWYLFSDKPTINRSYKEWDLTDYEKDEAMYVSPDNYPKNFDGSWKKSLFKRPNTI